MAAPHDAGEPSTRSRLLRALRWPAEGTQRALAFGAAVLLPLALAILVGVSALQGPAVLVLLAPVAIVAAVGGLLPGLLAVGIGLLPSALQAQTIGPLELAWLGAFAVLGVVGSMLLDTGRQHVRLYLAERAEAESNRRFQQVAAGLAGDCAWQGHLTSQRLLLDRVSAGFQRTLGMTLDEVNARGGWGGLLHADDGPAMFNSLATLGAVGEASNELRYPLRRGLVRLQCDLRIDHVAGQRVVTAVVRDVTARSELVEQLRLAKERFEAAALSNELMLLEVDWASQQVLAAGATEALLGQRAVDLSGPLADWIDRIHPEDADRVERALRDAVGEAKSFDVDYRLRHAEGHYLVVEHRAGPCDGASQRLVGFVRDFGEQRALEQNARRLERELSGWQDELRDADRRRDEFLATLAHELRNPLAPIRNASMLLALQDGNPQSIDWVRRVIDRQTDHLARLIDDLLDVSRITRGKLSLRLERLELSRIVGAAVDGLRSQVEAQRHQLKVDVPAGVWLQGDQVRLTQVFANLLNNAVKYTSPGGALEIAASMHDGSVSVLVRDNGVGIPSDQLPHIFEMFYQVDRAIERAHAGLGIGLTLVDRLVRLHGGEVLVTSGGIGRGSEFTVRLPIADRPARAESPRAAGGRAIRGLRVLVADDSVDSALTLTALLAAAGHEVEAVHDGFAALTRAAQFRPHVLVLDIGMPGLNGYDTCRRIRGEPWGRNAVVIAVTGWGTDEDRRRSREAGFDAHLVKPVDYAELQKHFSADNIVQ